MLAILSKAIPFRDYVYAAAAIAAVVWYNVHVHNLEVQYAATRVAAVKQAVSDASAQALSAAKKLVDAKDKDYAEHLSQVEDTYETQLQDSDARHTADLNRVRQLEAAGNSGHDSVLSGSGGAGSGAVEGPSRDQLLGVGAELADALRHDDAQLQKCWAERDSLTGK